MIYLIDITIIVVLVFYLIEGYHHGFIKNFLDLIGFFISFLLAYITNEGVSAFLVAKLSIPLSPSKIIAFLLIWLVVDIIYSVIIYFVLKTVPVEVKENQTNKILGIIPAAVKFIAVILIILVLLTSLPFKELSGFRDQVEKTKIASLFLGQTSKLKTPFEKIFGRGLDDLVNFFTLPNQSSKSVALKYQVSDVSVDENSENEMLDLINQARRAQGIKELTMDDKLRDLARSHSKDMFERSYFSHYTPEGLSPFDRIKQAGIAYLVAGENLALAPDTEHAHEGLMASTGHRENILNSNYNKVGIGVIDGGIYGKMFSQEFTN
jgi:uncharacterized protein YkwD